MYSSELRAINKNAFKTASDCAGVINRNRSHIFYRQTVSGITFNHAAGVVVGKTGTATVAPEELLASFKPRR